MSKTEISTTPVPQDTDTPLLHVDDLTKRFKNTTALDHVTFEVRKNEVVGLVGENGAGKSTLLNVLSGIYSADEGRIVLDGETVAFGSPTEAARHGISIVQQEQSIVPNLTGYENLFLGRLGRYTTGPKLNRDALRERANTVIDDLGIDLDLGSPVRTYRFNERQMLEIARAFNSARDADHPILFLDEPTAALEQSGRDVLFDRIDDLRDRASFVFVSHELDEVLEVSDRIYVLKDGAVVDEMSADDATESLLQQTMVGRSTSDEYYRTNEQESIDADAPTVLSVEDLTVEDRIHDVSMDLREGEIFGIVGVEGSGKQDLGRALTGATDVDSGTIRFDGDPVRSGSVPAFVDAGIGYIPKERKSDGILLYQSLRENVSLPSIDTEKLRRGLPIVGRFLPIIDFESERSIAEDAVEDLAIKTPGIEALAHTLSGGNQQKVVIAKWLQRNVDVLVVDNVTRGIDVGAKEEVYRVIRQLAANGVSIVLIGDELPEVIGMSNRIGVMRHGNLETVVSAPVAEKPEEEDLIQEMLQL
ncbi:MULTISPECIES: sugar ABC transporter ATP-binding protein [unclassified Haladaptatus]|uniref:sugar ABC transporter ATP-binding protein n=1 Tax=unclassified Haladaptatus TaxID=2622732 RepID=UPI00209BC526|nr:MULTISPECIES: sugar ABC transporter ATP-binding protein [unclassified Haladaptatus]MCO8243573.1 sugar ABC transporter ATP-binding protein [Haladaptatus sp. AB643]MCO8254982.1 sugar ABC transporter ATP-binding protein [Haladaptatus sp. AB618]